jgi:hypothetical protein
MPNLGTAELLIITVLLVVISFEVAYWVIRLAVRAGVSDALRANRELLGQHDHGRTTARR